MSAERPLINKGQQRYKRYPAYKHSGLKWLGEIPAHWAAYALRRRLFREIGSIKIGPFGSELKLEFMVQSGFKVFGQEHVIAQDFKRGNKYIDKAKFVELAVYELKPGDLVVTMMGSSGRCAVVPEGIESGIMDSHLMRIRVPRTDVDPRFLSLLIDESRYVRDQIAAAGKGAIMHGLNSEIIKSLVLAVPPLSEQKAILSFVDRETSKIDLLVAKEKRLIRTLQEKSMAVITRAVTQGLDTTVRMKDSGIEWLGHVPQHWEVLTFRRLIDRIEQGWSPLADDRLANAEEWAVIKLSAVSRGKFLNKEHKALPDDLMPDARYEINDGDFLLTRANTPELVGDVCVASGVRRKLMLCDLVYRIRLAKRAEPRYLAYWLLSRAGRYQIEVDARGSSQSMVKISQGLIRAWSVTAPERREQVLIANFLDFQTAKLQILQAKVAQAITRLNELRAAIVTAAVTGDIDVRGGKK